MEQHDLADNNDWWKIQSFDALKMWLYLDNSTDINNSLYE